MLKPDIELQQEARKKAIPADIASRRLDGYLPFGSPIREEDGSYTIFFRKNRNIDGSPPKIEVPHPYLTKIQELLKENYPLKPSKESVRWFKDRQEEARKKGNLNELSLLFPADHISPQMVFFYNALIRNGICTTNDIISTPNPKSHLYLTPKSKARKVYDQVREIIMSEQISNSQT